MSRAFHSDTLIIADGFSCREQIWHGAQRWAVHPAEVLALAIQSRQRIPAERALEMYGEPPARIDGKAAIAGVGAAAAASLLLYVALRQSNAATNSRRRYF